MTVTVNNEFEADSTSHSYTPSSVSNSVLIVAVYSEDVGNDSPITGVDFGATAMTQAVIAESVLGSNSNDVAIFYLNNPGTSAATIQVNGGSGEGRISINGMTLGADSALTLGVTDTDTGTSVFGLTTNFTAANAGIALTAGVNGDGLSANWSPGAGMTASNATTANSLWGGLSYELVSSGADSHTYSGSQANRCGLATAVFYEGAGGGPVANPKGPLGHVFHGPFAGPLAA